METVFTALADPTRRQILDSLRAEGPMSIKQLSEPLPMSRQAVTKHLDLLCSSGLVRIERAGRERIHSLNPTPLRELEAWLRPYSEAWDRRLARLKQHLEENTDGGAN